MDGIFIAFSVFLMVYLVVDHAACRWREQATMQDTRQEEQR